MSVEALPIQRENAGPFAGIVVVRLEQPGKPVVVLDHDLIRRLEATIKSLPKDARGLVLASASERVFVAGADLKAISELDDDQLHRYLEYGSRVFGMLSQLPYPTAAAINGAALGGGLELAMHCDGLIAAPPPDRDGQPGKPYPVGLPEAGLSICPGWGGTNLLPARMRPERAIAMTASGTPMMFDQAREEGLFDEVAASQADLINTACRWVVDAAELAVPKRDGAPSRWIGRGRRAAECVKALDSVRADLPKTGSAEAVAAAVDAGLSGGWEAALKVERDRLVKLRRSPEGKAAIDAFFAKSAKPAPAPKG